jgi:Zn-dependent protease
MPARARRLCYHPGFLGGGLIESALTPERIAQGLTYYVVLLFSLSFHEAAHAWTALRLGDDTAARDGRITLNPLVHIDPVGTLLVPLLGFVWSGIPLLAWAKPTPVVAANFHAGWYRRGQILTAGAGPLSNFALALIFTVALFIYSRSGLAPESSLALLALIETGVLMNVALAVFNLVPLPPLDGSWIASHGLPRRLGDAYDRLVEPYGSWLLLLAVASGLLAKLTLPVIVTIRSMLHALAT